MSFFRGYLRIGVFLYIHAKVFRMGKELFRKAVYYHLSKLYCCIHLY